MIVDDTEYIQYTGHQGKIQSRKMLKLKDINHVNLRYIYKIFLSNKKDTSSSQKLMECSPDLTYTWTESKFQDTQEN